jgi:anti-anti-sigma regulatory factor
MNKVKLQIYGRFLTDRDDGVKIRKEILQKYELPVALDFTEIVSMGSSFGDEVVAEIALLQKNKITLIGCNQQIKNCIALVQEDSGIQVTFED